ncbi:MAG: triose-phosphate isomerase family protein [bacterium]|nr:triose-phosphate isomerase family protein [bacterium]
MKYLIANWKSTKNVNNALDWVKDFNDLLKNNRDILKKLDNDILRFIICPSYQLLYLVKEKILKHKNISLGSQDASFFEQGNYTGEVSAQNIKELVEYSIVGHSERRKYLKETDNVIDQKVQILKDYSIEPILCVRDENDLIPQDITFIAYEPVYAIGTGNNEDLAKVISAKRKIIKNKEDIFIYGGSVNSENIIQYSVSTEINGFLVGNASKDPNSFIDIASKI